MNKQYMYVYMALVHLSMVGAIVWAVKAEKRASYVEGQEYVWDSMAELEGHACGPYEQPVHPNFTRKAKDSKGTL